MLRIFFGVNKTVGFVIQAKEGFKHGLRLGSFLTSYFQH